MSNTPKLFGLYTSIAKGAYGNMFSFLDTNCRALLNHSARYKYNYGGFARGFDIIESAEGQDRDTLTRTRAGQSKEKQHEPRMRKAYFFQMRKNAFYITSRGKVFKKMLLDESLSDTEKRLLCYLLILPSSFSEKPNYIFARAAEIFAKLEMQGISNEQVMESIEAIIFDYNRLSRNEFSRFKYDYVYFDSFFENSVDFMEHWSESTSEEKSEFKTAVPEIVGILSKKYESGGNYTNTTVTENAWLLYVTKFILDAGVVTSFDEFIKILLVAYGRLFKISEKNLRKFIFNTKGNRSVFQIIYCELYNVRIPLEDVAKDLSEEEIEAYGIIDPTDEVGYRQREIFSASLKKIAKINAKNKCECESAEGCKYFTAKETGQTYLEIHHLIPREFTNDYNESIETLENYVALCPNCHRKIHHAVDNERKHLIRILYSERQKRLQNAGFEIELDKMFEYYRIDALTQ